MYLKLIPICFILIVALAPAEIGLAQSKPKLNVLLEEGQTQYRAQDFDASEDAFQRAIDVYPKSHLVHYWLGMVDYARQEDEAALKHFKKVVKIEPDHPDAILSVGSLGRISEQGL
jgi:TolA-binding protein